MMQTGTPESLVLVLVLGLLFAVPAAGATPSCPGVDTTLTTAVQSEYAMLVAKAVGKNVKPSQIKIFNLLRAGGWSAAYASTPISDDGVLFFKTVDGREQFKDVWGGWADESDKPQLVKWAKKLGTPDALAQCFAKLMTTHE